MLLDPLSPGATVRMGQPIGRILARCRNGPRGEHGKASGSRLAPPARCRRRTGDPRSGDRRGAADAAARAVERSQRGRRPPRCAGRDADAGARPAGRPSRSTRWPRKPPSRCPVEEVEFADAEDDLLVDHGAPTVLTGPVRADPNRAAASLPSRRTPPPTPAMEGAGRSAGGAANPADGAMPVATVGAATPARPAASPPPAARVRRRARPAGGASPHHAPARRCLLPPAGPCFRCSRRAPAGPRRCRSGRARSASSPGSRRSSTRTTCARCRS